MSSTENETATSNAHASDPEDKMKEGAGTAMAKDKSLPEGERVKMTMYVSKPVAKNFKKLAIDLERDYSDLATLALEEFVLNHSNHPSSTA